MHILKFYCHFRLALINAKSLSIYIACFYIYIYIYKECQRKQKHFFLGQDFRYLDKLNIQLTMFTDNKYCT